MMNQDYDVIIVGAGAAGMMCAIEAGKRGRRVWLIDHAHKLAEKIRISGGGRCNFTNIHASPAQYLSENPHFCKSALSQYTPRDFLKMVEKHAIKWHEKTLGQLFCDESAQQIIDMLKSECEAVGVNLELGTKISKIHTHNSSFIVQTNAGEKRCSSLVMASGGLSIPKIGASPFAYEVAKQFSLKIVDPRPALVPLTFTDDLLEFCNALSGVSVDAIVKFGKTQFREGLLFTHRGLSGPSILQISSYWREGSAIEIDLAPETDMLAFLKDKKIKAGKQDLHTVAGEILPKRLAGALCERLSLSGRLGDTNGPALESLANSVNHWQIRPAGTEGYRTAEVTVGGVDTHALSSKTMEARTVPGLYFIGEAVDVTGHLGGFNFQWAWSSGYAAGQHV